MKGGIKTRHLRDGPKGLLNALDDTERLRHMLGIQCVQGPQLGEQCWRRVVAATMHDSLPNGAQPCQESQTL